MSTLVKIFWNGPSEGRSPGNSGLNGASIFLYCAIISAIVIISICTGISESMLSYSDDFSIGLNTTHNQVVTYIGAHKAVKDGFLIILIPLFIYNSMQTKSVHYLYDPRAFFIGIALTVTGLGLTMTMKGKKTGFFAISCSVLAIGLAILIWSSHGALLMLKEGVSSTWKRLFVFLSMFLVATMYSSIQPYLINRAESDYGNNGDLWQVLMPYNLFFTTIILLVCWVTISVGIYFNSDAIKQKIKDESSNIVTRSTSFRRVTFGKADKEVYAFSLSWHHVASLAIITAHTFADYILMYWMRPYVDNLEIMGHLNYSTIDVGTFSGKGREEIGYMFGWGGAIFLTLTMSFLVWNEARGVDTYVYTSFIQILAVISATIITALWAADKIRNYNSFMVSTTFYGGASRVVDVTTFILLFDPTRAFAKSVNENNSSLFLRLCLYSIVKGLGTMAGVLYTHFGLELYDIKNSMMVSSILYGIAFVAAMFFVSTDYFYQFRDSRTVATTSTDESERLTGSRFQESRIK